MSAMLREAFTASPMTERLALIHITHNLKDLLSVPPTHALLLGQGSCAAGHRFGAWKDMEEASTTFFDDQRSIEAKEEPKESDATSAKETNSGVAAPLVEFREVTVTYPGAAAAVLERFSWTVRDGENWAIYGPNGSGKSTVLELITGENPFAYKNDISLFGRKRGSGESIWDIKKNIGSLSTAFHMRYVDYSDQTIRAYGHNRRGISTWEVVCSGFTDSVGLYSAIGVSEHQEAKEWIQKFNLGDLVPFPKERPTGGGGRTAGRLLQQQQQMRQPHLRDFFELSHGQQKLVLLCRAVVKRPRLLLLDEPSHGLSYENRDRLLSMLAVLAEAPDVAVVYVTHRHEEFDALGFENVLSLKREARVELLDV